MRELIFFPEQASTIAPEVDLIYLVLLGLSAVITFGIAGLIIIFAVRYRHSSDADRSGAPTGNWKLETTWSVIPLILSVIVFGWAASLYFDLEAPPSGNALEIHAIGKQWMWKFQHPNGAREINTLHVPVGRAVRLTMTSQDVIHSFFVPAFRVKQDLLPGNYTHIWFEVTKAGTYHLFCAEFCGSEHSSMRGVVRAMKPAEYERWLRLGSTGGSTTSPGTGRADRAPTFEEFEALEAQPYRLPDERQQMPSDAPGSLAAAGAQLFDELRCNTCHRSDSLQLYPGDAPVLEGLYGSSVLLSNRRSIVADERYIRESILNPQAKLVLGYPPIMPTYQGQITEEELFQLIAYVKSLADTTQSGATGTAQTESGATSQSGTAPSEETQ